MKETESSELKRPVKIAVIVDRRPSNNRWQRFSWRVSGVLLADHDAIAQRRGERLATADGSGVEQFIWGGLTLTLFKDQAESYYHNLMAPEPKLYVVTRPDPEASAELQGCPQPFLVTASFDEAHAYMEGDEDSHAVALPPPLYAKIEQFVLAHYVPEPRKKRRRQNWKADTQRGSTVSTSSSAQESPPGD